MENIEKYKKMASKNAFKKVGVSYRSQILKCL